MFLKEMIYVICFRFYQLKNEKNLKNDHFTHLHSLARSDDVKLSTRQEECSVLMVSHNQNSWEEGKLLFNQMVKKEDNCNVADHDSQSFSHVFQDTTSLLVKYLCFMYINISKF